MTNEELQALWDALREAHKAGLVQYRFSDGWHEKLPDDTEFELGSTYRIKPQPREVWIPEHDVDAVSGYQVISRGPIPGAIKFREVIE